MCHTFLSMIHRSVNLHEPPGPPWVASFRGPNTFIGTREMLDHFIFGPFGTIYSLNNSNMLLGDWRSSAPRVGSLISLSGCGKNIRGDRLCEYSLPALGSFLVLNRFVTLYVEKESPYMYVHYITHSGVCMCMCMYACVRVRLGILR